MPDMWRDKMLRDVDRCPYCGATRPTMLELWKEKIPVGPSDERFREWGAYKCQSCYSVVLTGSEVSADRQDDVHRVALMWPVLRKSSADLPDAAKKYLDQAFRCIHSPDGCAMLVGLAVDAMLKGRGLVKGSLCERINQAVEGSILTAEMSEWAHAVRLESNRPRHADTEDPHVSEDEARQVIQFAEALGEILFTLPSRVKAGLTKARSK